MFLATALVALFSALAQVESANGKMSDNVYQIRYVYVQDVNRICKKNGWVLRYDYKDVFDRKKSEDMMVIYWNEYGRSFSDEELARIHNGGPNGMKKKDTLKYWNKVKRALNGGNR